MNTFVQLSHTFWQLSKEGEITGYTGPPRSRNSSRTKNTKRRISLARKAILAIVVTATRSGHLRMANVRAATLKVSAVILGLHRCLRMCRAGVVSGEERGKDRLTRWLNRDHTLRKGLMSLSWRKVRRMTRAATAAKVAALEHQHPAVLLVVRRGVGVRVLLLLRPSPPLSFFLPFFMKATLAPFLVCDPCSTILLSDLFLVLLQKPLLLCTSVDTDEDRELPRLLWELLRERSPFLNGRFLLLSLRLRELPFVLDWFFFLYFLSWKSSGISVALYTLLFRLLLIVVKKCVRAAQKYSYLLFQTTDFYFKYF